MAQLEFDPWYRSERPKVVASVAAIIGRPSLAADAADEAFTRAFERWRRVATMDSPGGWVHRTALNVARRRLRREGQEGRLWRSASAGRPVESPPPMWPLDLWAALRALAPREREALVLRHVADLSTQDVASAMGVSQGTVKSTLYSARARLAIELTKEVTDV
jgi:RNA polymerase sigma-70 factor, ECF subfamily